MDAMVTGRMSLEKKEAGNKILASLGVSPSKAINQLYDYLIEKQTLPFITATQRKVYSEEEIKAALDWVDDFPYVELSDRTLTMSRDELRQERLRKAGLMDGVDCV